MNKKKAILISAASVLMLSFFIFMSSYLITTVSPLSICLAEGGISTKYDKIQGVKYYLDRNRNKSSQKKSIEISAIKSSACCTVDKGSNEYPNLDFSAFVTSGKTHYVHVPIQNSGFKNNAKYEMFSVDGCGAVISEGVDL